MSLSRRGLSRWLLGTVVALSLGISVAAQDPQDQGKSQDKKAEPQSQAQMQEVQGLVRVADAAMSGQQAPADFPIQFQNDFLRAQAGRVWVPITLTIDPSKVASTALTLYLRVVPRGMTAPPPPAEPSGAKDAKKDNRKDKKAEKDAAPAAPN